MLLDTAGKFVVMHAVASLAPLAHGAVELAVVKPCSCGVITSTGPDTGVKNSQILTVLRGCLAHEGRRIYFDQNVIVTKRPGVAGLRVGDVVGVLE